MSPSSTIPLPRNLLTNIFSPLPHQEQPSSEPLPPSLKPTLLTLHILFPNELLPALDLLDRNLITKFIVQDLDPLTTASSAQDVSETTEIEPERHSPPPPTSPSPAEPRQQPQTPPPIPAKNLMSLYYVTSSQTPLFNPRHGAPENQPTPHYEVRPHAWNCSCPAFAFFAFPTTPSSPISPTSPSRHHSSYRHGSPRTDGDLDEGTWEFGGLSLGEETPMCKHLLACIMVERWRGFGDGIKEREVSIEELAGWGAGWGG